MYVDHSFLALVLETCMHDRLICSCAPALVVPPPPPAEHAFSSDLASQLGHLFVDVHVHALASFRAFLPVRAHENCNRTTSHPTARNIENTYAQPKIQPNPRTLCLGLVRAAIEVGTDVPPTGRRTRIGIPNLVMHETDLRSRAQNTAVSDICMLTDSVLMVLYHVSRRRYQNQKSNYTHRLTSILC